MTYKVDLALTCLQHIAFILTLADNTVGDVHQT